jgi:hypothetical protein
MSTTTTEVVSQKSILRKSYEINELVFVLRKLSKFKT